MQDFLNKKIVLGICGGIAAYKTTYLIRQLTQLGAKVQVVMTDAAQAFVTPTTLQALSGIEVRQSLWDGAAERAMSHIELARWGDYLLIAPASADFIAKMAHGLADDLLSTLYLVAECPVIVCPAMNHSMWSHAATQSNIGILKQRSVIIVGPSEGLQACNEYGFGRMSEPDEMIDALRLVEIHQLLPHQKILITAGPTLESIDPVRYLSNHSSGKMGFALAKAAVMAGAQVTLISGPTKLARPAGLNFYAVQSAQEMLAEVMRQMKQGMLVFATAAVADYTIRKPAIHKIKRQNQATLTLELNKNPDILNEIVTSQLASFVMGFAAETEDVLRHAKEKLENKRLDMIVANRVGKGEGFDQDENQVSVLTKHQAYHFERMHKVRLAARLVALIHQKLGERSDSSKG